MADAYGALQAAMLNDVSKLRVLGHNIANVATPGYKKQIAVNRAFVDYLKIHQADSYGKDFTRTLNVTIPALRVETDTSMGTLNYTNRALDVASAGRQYFTVLTPNGVAYTKQGAFHVNTAGILVTTQNYPVLGKNGEIRLTNNQPRIDLEGKIWDDDTLVEQFNIVEFNKDINMNSLGSGLYVPDGYQLKGNVVTGKINQGYLEMSNVISMQEMVKMIDVTRHFETTQKLMKGYDDMLDKAINVVGDL